MNRKNLCIAATCLFLTLLAASCAQGASSPESNKAPTAVAGAAKNLMTDIAFTLDGSRCSDADGTVVAWNWDLGNGSNVSGKTAQASYDTAGTYTISLTVTDDDGATGNATLDVTVRDSGSVIVGVQ